MSRSIVLHEEPDIGVDGQVRKMVGLASSASSMSTHDPEGMVGEGRELVADLADVETASKDQRDVGVLQREVTGALANAARSPAYSGCSSHSRSAAFHAGQTGMPRRSMTRRKVVIRASMTECAAGQDDRALRRLQAV